MVQRRPPGEVRDAILSFLKTKGHAATISEICNGVAKELGAVPASSIRSYLRLNTPQTFSRVGRGTYKLAESK